MADHQPPWYFWLDHSGQSGQGYLGNNPDTSMGKNFLLSPDLTSPTIQYRRLHQQLPPRLSIDIPPRVYARPRSDWIYSYSPLMMEYQHTISVLGCFSSVFDLWQSRDPETHSRIRFEQQQRGNLIHRTAEYRLHRVHLSLTGSSIRCPAHRHSLVLRTQTKISSHC